MKFAMLGLVVVAASAMAAAVKAQPVIESRPLRAVLSQRQLSKPRTRQSLHRNSSGGWRNGYAHVGRGRWDRTYHHHHHHMH